MEISQGTVQLERPGVWHLQRVAAAKARPVAAHDDSPEARSSQRVALEHVAARRAARHASAVIASLQDGMLALDESGVITDVNQVFCEMTGYTRKSLLGKRAPYPFWSRGDARTNHAELKALACAESGGSTGSIWLTTRSGQRLPASVRISAMHNGEGDLLGHVLSVKLVATPAAVEVPAATEARASADDGFVRFEEAMRRLSTAILDGASLETACDLVAHSVASLTGGKAAWILEVSDQEVTMRGSWGQADAPDPLQQGPTVTLDALPLAKSWLVVQVAGPEGWQPAPSVETEARAYTAVLPILLGGLIASAGESRVRSAEPARARTRTRAAEGVLAAA